MSYTETHFGKLRRVQIDNDVTIEQWAESECIKNGIHEISRYESSWKNTLTSEVVDKYFFPTNLGIWEAIEHRELNEGDEINIVKVNEDSTVDFIVQFYNGGGSFDEVIEDELIKLNKNV